MLLSVVTGRNAPQGINPSWKQQRDRFKAHGLAFVGSACMRQRARFVKKRSRLGAVPIQNRRDRRSMS